MCGIMVDIQSATADISRGKKKDKRRQNKPQDKNIMSAAATQGGHKKRLKFICPDLTSGTGDLNAELNLEVTTMSRCCER